MGGKAVLSLEGAVGQGDLAAVKPQLRKFELFTTAYRNDDKKLAEIGGMVDKIIDAAQSGDKAVVQAEYTKLLKASQLKELLPKGARVIDTSSSIAGLGKFVDEN